MNKKFIWLISTGLLALLPFFVKRILELIFSKSMSLEEYIGKGDLYAITSIICFGCVVDVLFFNKTSESEIKITKAFYVLVLIIMGSLSSLCYGIELFIHDETFVEVFPTINMQFIIVSQFTFYIVALVIGTLSRQYT